ncbi:MAG: hypothetical protein ACR2PG_00510 [Hyphomicrobiaceae bacterium]
MKTVATLLTVVAFGCSATTTNAGLKCEVDSRSIEGSEDIEFAECRPGYIAVGGGIVHDTPQDRAWRNVMSRPVKLEDESPDILRRVREQTSVKAKKSDQFWACQVVIGDFSPPGTPKPSYSCVARCCK